LPTFVFFLCFFSGSA